MDKLSITRQDNPLAFLDLGYHHGGSRTDTVTLVRKMRRLTDVVLIDARGTCESDSVDPVAAGSSPAMLFPGWSRANTIGGGGAIQRLARMALTVPRMAAVVPRLYRTLKRVQPRSLCANSERALFLAWLAAPPRLPIAVMIGTEVRRIRPYCIPAWRRADAVISVSEKSLSQLDATGYAPASQHVVCDGIDIYRTLKRSKREPSALPRSAPNSLCLAFPAALAGSLKGHTTGITAVAKLIQWGVETDVWICGDAPPGASPAFYHSIRQLAVELGIQKHVHFVGDRDDIESVMASSDIVLFPSYTEGLSRSLMEAMALARPVIAAKVGAISELVRDGIEGFVVDPGDEDALAGALRLLSDPLVRQHMGATGQRRVCGHFSLRRQARDCMAIMDALACGAAQGESLRAPQMRSWPLPAETVSRTGPRRRWQTPL